MSSSNRTTSKGGKGSKTDNKTHKSEKSDTGELVAAITKNADFIRFVIGKGSDKQQANRDSTHSKSEDPSIKEKVRQLIEMSQRSEEEVCLALHECDGDVNTAMNMLLEDIGHVSKIDLIYFFFVIGKAILSLERQNNEMELDFSLFLFY
jgi:NACalpha-BTF3-like transcription factor